MKNNLEKFEEIVQDHIYVHLESKTVEHLYWSNGAAGEMGEVCNEVKKEIRDGGDRTERIISEIGDVLFYLSALAKSHGFKLEDSINQQIKKLEVK